MKLNFTPTRKVENITLFTDASYAEYPDFGYEPTAGGAFWAKGGTESSVKQSGRFQIQNAKSSTDAEMLAALKAIGYLLENPDFNNFFRLGSACKLILVTDCTAVQTTLLERRGSILRGDVANEAKVIFSAIDSLGFKFAVNWVKSHNNDPSARTWVNNFCDRHAKIARMEQVKARVKNEVIETYRDLTQTRLID